MSKPRPTRLEIVHPPSLFGPPAPAPDLTGLEHIGSIYEAEAYATPDLIAEVLRAQALGGLGLGNVYHATSSAALPAIARHKALLSSRRLIELGERPTTGEINTPVGSVHRAMGGLEDVYASYSPVDTRYSFAAEGDYAVILGIERATLQNRAHLGMDNGDGIRLGEEVLLASVATLTVPYEQVEEAQSWSEGHCRPGVLALSGEAAMVLNLGIYRPASYA